MGCCEQVLELLTEGAASPREHQLLAEHLCDCPSCRRLAEALSPAVELFREVLREDAESEDPEFASVLESHRGMWDDVPQDSLSLSPSAAGKSRWNGASWWGVMGMAAALLLGVMLGGIANSTHRQGLGVATPPASPRAVIDAIGLAQDCWQSPAMILPVAPSQHNAQVEVAGHLARPDLADLNCCTYCHSADKPLKPAVAKTTRAPVSTAAVNARLQMSCQLCHASAKPADLHSPLKNAIGDLDGLFSTARVQ